ncbi:hypothetical protein JQX13_32880 [Archangium violaceum]|uniref:hypothetical protein n=1 Tax=Archangium violaceum TaxID=83451 RepID=UPI00193C353E|nr:hypothetical protein [Archangium violaceum]QRK04984.1 hypothetical protein JQX13_32880 [Archangium violaceum]
MRPLLLIATLTLFCACPSNPTPPSGDAGTTPPGETPAGQLPPELKPPTQQLESERPPEGSGLPSNLKPPEH